MVFVLINSILHGNFIRLILCRHELMNYLKIKTNHNMNNFRNKILIHSFHLPLEKALYSNLMLYFIWLADKPLVGKISRLQDEKEFQKTQQRPCTSLEKSNYCTRRDSSSSENDNIPSKLFNNSRMLFCIVLFYDSFLHLDRVVVYTSIERGYSMEGKSCICQVLMKSSSLHE